MVLGQLHQQRSLAQVRLDSDLNRRQRILQRKVAYLCHRYYEFMYSVINQYLPEKSYFLNKVSTIQYRYVLF